MHVQIPREKIIRRYMEALALHTVAPTVHWEDNKNIISVFEAKIITPRVKHVYIPVCFIQEPFDKIVSLFQNIRSSVSCRNICARNHVQVQ